MMQLSRDKHIASQPYPNIPALVLNTTEPSKLTERVSSPNPPCSADPQPPLIPSVSPSKLNEAQQQRPFACLLLLPLFTHHQTAAPAALSCTCKLRFCPVTTSDHSTKTMWVSCGRVVPGYFYRPTRFHF